ncbi:uncharacterized mitochondrial protein-like protein, partial [Tanacetum coccineum]
GVDLLTGSRGKNPYTLSLGDMMASSPISRHSLVRGLPKLKFEKDHLCSACVMGKSKKKPHKPKSEDTNQEKLYLLHMDLCEPMRLASVNGKNVDHPSPEVIAPIAEVVAPEPAASTGSPSSTIVDQDTPSPNVAHMNNDSFFGIPILENHSEASSSSDVIPIVVHTAAPYSEHVTKWTKDHPLDNIIACWIEVMQEELNESERLEVWELVPRPDKVMVITLKWIYKVKLDELGGLQISQSPRGIFINQSKYALESLRKYGMESSDPVDTPMVEKSKLDEDTQRKVIEPTHYRGMVGTIMYLTASADHTSCQDTRRSTSGCMQLLGDRLVSWSSKRQKSDAISITEAEYIALSGCCAQVLWMRSQLTDYGLGFNKIPMYCDNKSAIGLCCNNLADIFTKAIGRERIEFLINKLGMRSFTLETLKQLANEVEE